MAGASHLMNGATLESTIVPGWYPDPDGNQCDRYWDGQNWTLKTRPVTAPIPTSPANVNRISVGWWVTIIILGTLAIALLAFASQYPEFYY